MFAFLSLAFIVLAWSWFLAVAPPYRLLALGPVAMSFAFTLLWLRGRGWRVLPLAMLAILILPDIAWAAPCLTVGELFGDMRPSLTTILSVAATGLTGLIGWAVYRVTGVNLDEKFRSSLQGAMENGIQLGLGAIQGAADRADPSLLQNQALQVALGYVRDFVPDAVRHFGLNDDALSSLLRAQLAKVLPFDLSAISGAPIRP